MYQKSIFQHNDVQVLNNDNFNVYKKNQRDEAWQYVYL